MTSASWVIGSTGLLGRAVTRALSRRAGVGRVISEPLPWSDHPAFLTASTALLLELTSRDEPWTIYWCAGAGVVGSSRESLDREHEQFLMFLEILGDALERPGANQEGAIFYASSAGGVYAGSLDPPFTENTIPVPISDYGSSKLRTEAAVASAGKRLALPVVIGRISNLYGADQRLDKAQGLISHLCRSALGGPPTSLYVSLDTIRDYLHADDCAEMVLDAVERLRREVAPTLPIVKILASEQPTTISSLLGISRSIFKRRPNVMIGASAHAAAQVRDLRLKSTVWPELAHRGLKPLPVGFHEIAERMRRGALTEQ